MEKTFSIWWPLEKKKILLPLLLMDHNYCTSLSMVCGPVQPSFMTKWGKGTHGPTPWGRGKKEKNREMGLKRKQRQQAKGEN